MTTTTEVKQLMKILIGAAWIDGKVQPEEREYLHQMAKDNGIAEDSELKPFLYELRQVTPTECYRWLENYLGKYPRPEDYQRLIEALSGLIYSDGNVAIEEAKLLSRIQSLDPAQSTSNPIFDKVLRAVRKLYRQAINQQA